MSTATNKARREGAASVAASRPARTRLHLTRRGRVVLALAAALPLVVAALMWGVGGGGAVAAEEAPSVSFSSVTVHSGESLWGIAREVAPEADPRVVVDAIMDLNQMSSAVLVPGQRVAIPHDLP